MNDLLTFRQWYMALPKEEKLPMRETIKEECDIGDSSLYGFIQENRPVPKLVREKIQEIAERDLDFPFEQQKKAS